MLHVAVLTHRISEATLHFPGYCLQTNSSGDCPPLYECRKRAPGVSQALATATTWRDTQPGDHTTLTFPALGHSLADFALTAHHEYVTSKSIDSANMFRHIIRHTQAHLYLIVTSKTEFNCQSLETACSRKANWWTHNLSIFHPAQTLHSIKAAFAKRHLWKKLCAHHLLM